ncbi:MAG: acetate--CoA ligase family protein [Syntrophobacteraceae bacterium]
MILPEYEANRLLADAGLPMIPVKGVESVDEAKNAAAAFACPVVLKLSSSKHTHKTEIGGVCLNLTTTQDLTSAFQKLEALRRELDEEALIILEPMAESGSEFFIGFQRHPQFGPVLSFGLGGISLELFKDVAFRLLPARAADFREMLSELKSWPKMRDGFRSLPPVEEANVIDLLEKTAAFALDHPEVDELDLNPVIMTARGATIADAAIILDRSCRSGNMPAPECAPQ